MITSPYEKSRLAVFISTRVLQLKAKKTQAEIAAEAGFINST